MWILFRWRSQPFCLLRFGYKRGRSDIRYFTSWVQLPEVCAQIFQLFLIQATGLLRSFEQIREILFRKFVPFRSTHIFSLYFQPADKITLAGRNVTFSGSGPERTSLRVIAFAAHVIDNFW